jgi:hypothetical protein
LEPGRSGPGAGFGLSHFRRLEGERRIGVLAASASRDLEPGCRARRPDVGPSGRRRSGLAAFGWLLGQFRRFARDSGSVCRRRPGQPGLARRRLCRGLARGRVAFPSADRSEPSLFMGAGLCHGRRGDLGTETPLLGPAPPSIRAPVWSLR